MDERQQKNLTYALLVGVVGSMVLGAAFSAAGPTGFGFGLVIGIVGAVIASSFVDFVALYQRYFGGDR